MAVAVVMREREREREERGRGREYISLSCLLTPSIIEISDCFESLIVLWFSNPSTCRSVCKDQRKVVEEIAEETKEGTGKKEEQE